MQHSVQVGTGDGAAGRGGEGSGSQPLRAVGGLERFTKFLCSQTQGPSHQHVDVIIIFFLCRHS